LLSPNDCVSMGPLHATAIFRLAISVTSFAKVTINDRSSHLYR